MWYVEQREKIHELGRLGTGWNAQERHSKLHTYIILKGKIEKGRAKQP